MFRETWETQPPLHWTISYFGENWAVAYRLELPKELSKVHDVFNDSNLKKCLSDKTPVIPIKDIRVDENLNFVEEPIEILDREIKRLKRSRIPLIKVHWNSLHGPEFKWELKDEFRKRYPKLFTSLMDCSERNPGRVSSETGRM